MAHDLGDVVGLAITVKNAAGAAANATTVVCTITQPDGTTNLPTVANPTTGSYTVDFTPSQVGRHMVRWVATGTNAGSYTDVFDVNDPIDLPVISLADAKTYLNITSTANDEELRQFILEASDLAESITGRRFRRRTWTENYNGGHPAINLRQFPVVSIGSVVESGTTLVNGTDYVVNPVTGTLTRMIGIYPWVWRFGMQNVTVTYVAGEANPSPNAQLLVKEIVKHLWSTQRGSSPMGMGSRDEYLPGAANILTYRIQELAQQLAVPTVA